MSLDSGNASAPRVFALSDLGQSLDQQSTAIAERPLALPPTSPPAPSLPSFFKRIRDYGLRNWAKRWRDMARGRRAERGDSDQPKLWAIRWFFIANGLILAACFAPGIYSRYQEASRPVSPAEFMPMTPELDALVSQLAIAPPERNGDVRTPQRLAGLDIAPGPVNEACLGTAITFLPTRVAAAEEAERTHRLLFILNLSGDFEDSRFT